jgi:hypothetical protein
MNEQEVVVSVQIAVPRDTPAAERVFALADRLHAIAVDGAASSRRRDPLRCPGWSCSPVIRDATGSG